MSGFPRLLYPLDEFYAHAGSALPSAHRSHGEEIPEPYRQILVHNRDMTPTLEAFHRERIHLRVLARRQDDETLRRQVVLKLVDSGHPVEFAAIVIYLQHFPSAAREEILEGRRPFGAILNGHRIEHQGSPLMYLQVMSDGVINAALHLTRPQPLYGRRNVIRDSRGRELAETLEILPPTREGTAWRALQHPRGNRRIPRESLLDGACFRFPTSALADRASRTSAGGSRRAGRDPLPQAEGWPAARLPGLLP